GRSMGSAGFMKYYPDANLHASTISPIEHDTKFGSTNHHYQQKHIQEGYRETSLYRNFNSSVGSYVPHSSFRVPQQSYKNRNQLVNTRHSLSNQKNHQSYSSSYHNRNINSMSVSRGTSSRNKFHQQSEDEIGGKIRVGVGMGMPSGQQDGVSTIIPTGPRFDRSLPRNVTVQVDKTAVLSCRVLNIADKSVAWIRHEDLHILTVDKYRYTTDKRVSTVYNEVAQEWVLRIRKVTHDDAGMYECQVSTKPILSFIVNMEVVDALQTTPFPKLSDEENQEEIENSTKT
ncbi:unnamed protein product, partial [Meganyctiphanes norvegica]